MLPRGARPGETPGLASYHPLECICKTINGPGRRKLKQKTTEISTFDRIIDADDEGERMLQILATVLEGLGGVVSPNTELILHDMRDPSRSTVALVNGHVTGRQIGDPIIAAPVDDKGFELLLEKRSSPKGMVTSICHYRSRTKDGRELLSTTVLLRNRKGLPFASVCANADLTDYQILHAALGRLIAPSTAAKDTKEGSRPNLDEMIEEIVAEAIQRAGIPVALMDKAEKLKVVSELTRRGVFMIKGAVERVAQALGVTRFTVYNYLEALGFPGKEKPDAVNKKTEPVKAARKTARRRSS
jgi:predicted transcriptional regulator YheO